MDYRDFILSELQRVGHPFKNPTRGSKWVSVRCVNLNAHKHGDATPSLRIAFTGDGNVPAKCWSCPFKGSWNGSKSQNGVAQSIGATPIDSKQSDVGDPDFDPEPELRSMGQDLVDIDNNIPVIKLPKDIELWRGDYIRDGKVMLGSKTLKQVPTYLWHEKNKYGKITERIMWPVAMNKKLYGYVGRRLDKSDFMRYKNSTGSWAKYCFFPYDYYETLETVVLVEGPTDALRLIDNNIPAMAILGAMNWGDSKEGKGDSPKIPLLIKKGIKNVLLAFDGDSAGKEATRIVNASCEKVFNTAYFKLPKGVDPGKLDSNWLRHIRRTVRDTNNNRAA